MVAQMERGWWRNGVLLVAQTDRCWWRRRSTVGGAAGVRLVAQTERGGSAVRARTERGWGAVRAQLERGRSGAGALLVAQTEYGW